MLRRAIISAVALTTALLGLVPVARAAQEGEQPLAARVIGLSPFVDQANPMTIAVEIVNDGTRTLTDVGVVFAIHPPVLSRSQLRQALDEGSSRSAIQSGTLTRRNPLRPGERTVMRLTRPAAGLPAFSATGVYPLTIIASAGGRESVIRTAMPYVASEPLSRLNLTWLMPLGRSTALRAGGSYVEETLRAMDIGGLAAQMDAIAARPGIQVTLLPEGSFVDTLVDMADGFVATSPSGARQEHDASHPLATSAAAALQGMRAAGRVVGEVGSVAYTPADLEALTAHGLGSDVLRQIGAGRRAVEQHVGRTPSFRFLAPPRFRIGPREATTLSTLGIEGVVIDPATLPEQPPTPAEFPGLRYELFGVSRPVLVRAGPERFGALLIDPDLRARLQQDDQSVLLAQALIAETASSWLEVPVFAADRLLVVAASSIPAAPALAAALDGLASAPWLQMRTASDALAMLSSRGPPLEVDGGVTEDSPNLARARRARASLELLEQIAVEPHPRAAEFERMVLLAESDEWAEEPAVGAALAGVAVRTVDEIVNGLKVVPRVVTLTSRTGALPVTITNESRFAVRIRVRLTSTKASFPEGETVTVALDESEATSVDFAVETLAAGSFPITIHLENPSDGRTLARGSVIVRSTAVSAVALVAVGGGALFLVLGSLHRGRKRRNGGTARAG